MSINISDPDYVFKEEDENKEEYKKQIYDVALNKYGYMYAELVGPYASTKFGEEWANNFFDRRADIRNFSLKMKKDFEKYDKYGFYPSKENFFKAFELVKLENVKCVIWGQDPYPSETDDGTPRAQGLSFSVKEDDKIPVSLSNIFKNIKSTYPNFIIPKGDISYLCKEGVLLLNACLVYFPYFNSKVNKDKFEFKKNDSDEDEEIGNEFELKEKYLKKQYDNYMKTWMPFAKIVIDVLNTKHGIVHMLWGDKAKNLSPFIISKNIFKSGHPSGMAYGSKEPFLSNQHFLKCNIVLRENKKGEINWQNPDYSDSACYLDKVKK